MKNTEPDLAIPRVLLPHLVLVLLAHLAELTAELHVDLEVEVALVALVGLHAEVAAQLFALRPMKYSVKRSLNAPPNTELSSEYTQYGL